MISHRSNVIMIHVMKDAIVKKVMYSTMMVIVLNQDNVQVCFLITFVHSDVIKEKMICKIF